MIELVDYNETYNVADKPAKKKSTRRGRSKKATEAATVEAPQAKEAPAAKEDSDNEKPETSQE